MSCQFAYSLDGTNFTLIGSPQLTIGTPATLTQISLTGIPALQNISDTQTVTIRYYASGQTTTGGWGFTSATAGTYGLAFGGVLTPVGGGDTTSPALVSTSPATGTSGILTTANLTLTYDESLVAGSGTIAIKKFSDNSTVESITVPSAQVTIAGATATINPATVLDYTTHYYLDVTAGTFTDASINGVAEITGNGTMNFTTRAAASLVISQYYEGASSNHYIELQNLTGSPITMDGYRLAAWSTGDGNQAWKSGTNTTTRVTALDGLTIPANGYYLICDPAVAAPTYAAANHDLAPTFPSGVAFGGTASVVLYSSATNDQNSIADAISITGSEGTDISFYRLDNLPGFDFTTGTSITNYSSTWATKTVALVDSASVSDDWYLQASQPPKILTLDIAPTNFSEGTGAGAATGTVTRSGPGSTSGDLVVTITSSDISEASADATVTILDGQTVATFPINAVNDLYLDGDVQVTITVSATSYTPANQQLTVTDEPTDSAFPVVINELDSDQAGSDTGEFIELYNNSPSAVSLDGVILVFYNGASNTSYRTVDLTGKSISGNGFFVVGNPGVANVGISFPNDTLQNGEDAVALYLGLASAFPNGTAVATTAGKLVDAVVYGTADSDAAVLIAALTPGKPQVNEGANPASEAVAIARRPDGGAAFDSTLYVAQAPSPGLTNILPPPNDYANWIAGFYEGVTDPLIIGFDADPDHDGIPNGVEALIGGNPSVAGVFATSEMLKAGNVFSFVYPQDSAVPVGVTAAYEWSTDLENWRGDGGSFGGVTVTLSDGGEPYDNTDPEISLYQVTATVTDGTAPKLFVRVAAKN